LYRDESGLVPCRLDVQTAGNTLKALAGNTESTSLTLHSNVGFQVTNNCYITRAARDCPYRDSQERTLLREVKQIMEFGQSGYALDPGTTFHRICNIKQLQTIASIHFTLKTIH